MGRFIGVSKNWTGLEGLETSRLCEEHQEKIQPYAKCLDSFPHWIHIIMINGCNEVLSMNTRQSCGQHSFQDSFKETRVESHLHHHPSTLGEWWQRLQHMGSLWNRVVMIFSKYQTGSGKANSWWREENQGPKRHKPWHIQHTAKAVAHCQDNCILPWQFQSLKTVADCQASCRKSRQFQTVRNVANFKIGINYQI